jgi:diacylglycerol kinase family enzyme
MTAQALAHSAIAPVLPAATPSRVSRIPSRNPHLLLVANGNASGLSRRPTLVDDSAQLLRSAGARVETRVTTSLEELDHALATAERRVVLLGGDGSLHAARLAVEGVARPVDAISVETPTSRYLAVEGISVGFHAMARTQYTAKNSTDIKAAIRAGIGAVRNFEPPTIALSVDGDSRLVKIAQLFVANMPLYGPKLQVAPADPTDGLLDLVSIEGGRRTLLAALPHLRRGTHIGREGISHRRATTIKIATRGRSPIVADTTDVGDTAELTIAPHALRIVKGAA